jgi:hypothetical protein
MIIPRALIERAQEIRRLGRAGPITFEETLSHHPQKATRMLAVYAFFIDDDLDMRRAWYSAGHSEERLLISQVTANLEGHISAPVKARTTSRLIEPSSAIQSLMQINGTLSLLAIHFRSGRQRKPRRPGRRFWILALIVSVPTLPGQTLNSDIADAPPVALTNCISEPY